MSPQRYVLGFAFTWDDLIAVARERARFSGRRQKVTRHVDSWLIADLSTPPQPTPAATEAAASERKS